MGQLYTLYINTETSLLWYRIYLIYKHTQLQVDLHSVFNIVLLANIEGGQSRYTN